MKNHGIAFFEFETADIFNDLFLNISKKGIHIYYIYIFMVAYISIYRRKLAKLKILPLWKFHRDLTLK